MKTRVLWSAAWTWVAWTGVLLWFLASPPVGDCTPRLLGAAEQEARAVTSHTAPTPEEVAKHETEPSGSPIEWNKDLALWSLVTFVIFLLVLKKLAWSPLITALDQRESRVRHDIAEAESARLKAEQMLAEHVKKMSKVQEEVREILAEARRDAEHVKQNLLSEAQKEADASKQRALSEIGRARDAALKDLFDVMAAQVASATEHVLGRSVTGADQDRLIQEALAQFPGR